MVKAAVCKEFRFERTRSPALVVLINDTVVHRSRLTRAKAQQLIALGVQEWEYCSKSHKGRIWPVNNRKENLCKEV